MSILSRRCIVAASALTIPLTLTASAKERSPNVAFFLVAGVAPCVMCR